jgi:hypothetical protein
VNGDTASGPLPVKWIGRQAFSKDESRLSRVFAQREIENDCLFTRDQGNLPNHALGGGREAR